jgi:hypothetical protein
VIAWSALPCQGQRSRWPAYPVMSGQLDIHHARFPHPHITEADTKPLRTVPHHHQVQALVVWPSNQILQQVLSTVHYHL